MTGDTQDLAQTGPSRSLSLAVSVLAGVVFLVVLVTGFVGPLLLAGLVAVFVVGACVQHPIVGLVLLILDPPIRFRGTALIGGCCLVGGRWGRLAVTA